MALEDPMIKALYDKYHYNVANDSHFDAVRNVCIPEVPRLLPESQQIVFGLLYPLIFVTAVTGNILVLFVVLSNKEMQSVTNVFIANLAASDLLVNFTCLWLTPLYIHLNQWIWGTFMCYCLPLFQGIATFNSTLTLMAIAIDRYIVILHPFRPRISKSLSLGVILSIWMLSFLLVLPYAVHMQIIPKNEPRAATRAKLFCDDTCELCVERWGWQRMQAVYGASLVILQFIIPFTTSAYCYSMIWRRINHRQNMSMAQQSSKTDATEVTRKRRLLKMLIAMVAVFVACFLPIQSLNVYRDLGFPFGADFIRRHFLIIFLTVHVISMSATCWNPILFAWMNENFRREFKAVLPCFSGRARVNRAFSIRHTNPPRAPPASMVTPNGLVANQTDNTTNKLPVPLSSTKVLDESPNNKSQMPYFLSSNNLPVKEDETAGDDSEILLLHHLNGVYTDPSDLLPSADELMRSDSLDFIETYRDSKLIIPSSPRNDLEQKTSAEISEDDCFRRSFGSISKHGSDIIL